MVEPLPKDQAQRVRALQPDRSFIVQAPAGSGKTELLIQRYLRLLATVDEPEEVIAVTFTRKAVAEMRCRVTDSLQEAQNRAAPSQAHQRQTWGLAKEVLKRDREREWCLLQNPSRLRIRTIDSLCATLARQAPLRAHLGGQPAIIDDASELYQEAARETLRTLEDGEVWSDAVADLLRHQDNQSTRVETMIAAMLTRRDQWLRHVVGLDLSAQARLELESGLERIVTEALQELCALMPPELKAPWLELACFAVANLSDEVRKESDCGDFGRFPKSDPKALPQWLWLADMVLTKEGTLRARVSVHNGFPPPNSATDASQKELFKQKKEDFYAFCEELSKHRLFLTRLRELRTLPPIGYSDAQWQILRALLTLLKVAVAQLRLVMAERNEVDHIEIAMRARSALGEDELPSRLALTLDYRLRHILVDEFQDSSYGQFDLIAQLTAGWEPDDGRTLFLVGDPMQSIYRFREAEVGLYLAARQHGIGSIRLEPITLSVNFRSQRGVVDWINRGFSQIFPQQEEIATGAVTYTPSQAYCDALHGEAVSIHSSLERDDQDEAERIRELVAWQLKEEPQGTIAILARNRSHLATIVPNLSAAGIRFQALEIAHLNQQTVIQDLIALTRALVHPADRIAWLALLRAPWCGLTLVDLATLCGDDHHHTIWELMQDEERCLSLSENARVRLQAIREVLGKAIADARKGPLSGWVKGTWQALGGAKVARSSDDHIAAEAFFEVLQRCDHGGDLSDLSVLEKALEKLYAPIDAKASEQLQVMTIHKAKGLEFDAVIVPGLGLQSQSDQTPMLQWLERKRSGFGSDLILAPIKQIEEKSRDPVGNYLHFIERKKAQYEQQRLLYVAATRAKKRLHLFGHVDFNWEKGELKSPRNGSLLATLWPAVEERFSTPVERGAEKPPQVVKDPPGSRIRRLSKVWDGTVPAPGPDWSQEMFETPHLQQERRSFSAIFDWAGEAARHVGLVVHRYLQRISQEGLTGWDRARVQSLKSAYEQALLHSGVTPNQLQPATDKVEKALLSTLEDDRGCWILSADHLQADAEYGLSFYQNGRPQSVVIDRTFVDKAGVRWIIDYKTGDHQGGGLEQFINREQERYRDQLEGYAALFRQIEPKRPIAMGLYFPLISGWRSWTLKE